MLFTLLTNFLLFFFSAQVRIPGPGGNTAASAYTGPGDVTSGAFAWWGLRAYSSAKRGTKMANVCDAADAHCVDMLSDATTGSAVVPSSNPNCGSSACTIKILYDQAGTNCTGSAACDLTQTTIASRPTLTTSCIAALVCMTFSSTHELESVNNGVGFSAPYSATVVYQRTGNLTSYSDLLSETGGTWQMGGANATNTAFTDASGGLPTITAADNAWHAFNALTKAGSAGILRIDSTVVSSANTGSGSILSNVNFALGNKTNPATVGTLVEAGFWASDVSANFASMNSNQHSYWGF